MSDIFISYTRKDRPRAEVLAQALERQGWSVWWDRAIPAGRTFDEVIEEAIDSARCIVVLWSKSSAPSRWVRTEAEEGARRNVLVPIQIEKAKIPLAFRRIQAANLVDWTGEESAPDFQRLVVDISAILGRPPRVDDEKRRRAAAEVKRRAEEEAQRKAEVEEERRRVEAVARREAEEAEKWRQAEAAALAAPQLAKSTEPSGRSSDVAEKITPVSPKKIWKRALWVVAAAVLGVALVVIVRPWFSKTVPTASLQAEAAEVELGSSTVLTYSTTDATEIRLEPGENLQEARGSITVTPDQDTAYKLVAKGAGGTVEDSVRIKVVTPKPVATPKLAPGDMFQDCDVCPKMVIVPGGSFLMGSPKDEVGRDTDEGPPHKVSIASFALGKSEVTRREFAVYAQSATIEPGGCWFWDGKEGKQDAVKNWQGPGFSQTDEDPVVCVNWEDAKGYVDWLSRRTDHEYRLASESEWEYAARAKTETSRFWGDNPDSACDFANVADQTLKESYPDLAWPIHDCEDGHVRTAPVGNFQANFFGLNDMLGNVWEWTEDCWNANYTGAPDDGSAWVTGNCSARVVRGGSWLSGPRVVRSADRYRNDASNRSEIVGFRVARTLP